MITAYQARQNVLDAAGIRNNKIQKSAIKIISGQIRRASQCGEYSTTYHGILSNTMISFIIRSGYSVAELNNGYIISWTQLDAMNYRNSSYYKSLP